MLSLFDIKEYLSTVKTASLAQLSLYFKVNPEFLRTMLSHWVVKGKVRQCMKKPACGTACFKCKTLDIEYYEWC